jgi:hypothetical protein
MSLPTKHHAPSSSLRAPADARLGRVGLPLRMQHQHQDNNTYQHLFVIPELVLRQRSKRISKDGEDEAASSAFDGNLDLLHVDSLVPATAETDVCRMHAPVQFCTRIWLCSFGEAERRTAFISFGRLRHYRM